VPSLNTQKQLFVLWLVENQLLYVLNNFTKKNIRQNMLSFRGNDVLANKILKVKSRNRIPKTVQSIIKNPNSYHILRCLSIYDLVKIQDWALEATKTYEVASTGEYKHNPQT
jgi:hypothetical protein